MSMRTGMVVGQKKMAHNQIMSAVAQMWFMAAVCFSLYQIEIYANVNALINFRLQQIESNYAADLFGIFFLVSMQ